MSRRLVSGVIRWPLAVVSSLVSSSRGGNNHKNNYNYQKTQNVYFKSKILILIGLIFLGSNLLLSSLIFNVNNYSEFVEITKNLGSYLHLHKKYFQSKEFLNAFKLSNNKQRYFINENLWTKEFNQNYSATAITNYLIHSYENEDDVERYLKTHELDFHWGDWVDLSPANAFIESYDSLVENTMQNETEMFKFMRDTCYNKLYDVRDPWVDQETYDQKLSVLQHLQDIGICSAIFKYYYATIPERIIVETDYKYFEMPVNQKRLQHPIGIEGMIKKYYNKEHVSSKELSSFDPNNRTGLVDKLHEIYNKKGFEDEDLSLKPTLTHAKENFLRPDVKEMIKQYSAIKNPSKEDTKYLNFLKFSDANVRNANKFYFIFPFIQIDSKAEMHHYTFPWIKQIISHEERIKVVHHLVRSWFKYCEHAHIVTWFNYGNLIGWYYNAQNLPWDNDVDVQLSIADCDKLGRYHNNSLILENPKNGDAFFWLQTNPFYLQQNDAQFIDARYIDVKTGIYIDISALWHTDRTPPPDLKPKEDDIAFHCKHFNWFVYSDIFPLRRTLYEGAQAYMPNRIDEILDRFYGEKSMKKHNIYDHNWQADIGLWVPNQICELKRVPKTEDRFDNKGELTLYGACNNSDILREWRNTKDVYEVHKQEHKALRDGKPTESYSKEDFPIFRHFDFDEYR